MTLSEYEFFCDVLPRNRECDSMKKPLGEEGLRRWVKIRRRSLRKRFRRGDSGRVGGDDCGGPKRLGHLFHLLALARDVVSWKNYVTAVSAADLLTVLLDDGGLAALDDGIRGDDLELVLYAFCEISHD